MLYDERSRVVLILWDPLDESHAPLRTPFTDEVGNGDGCALYVCQVDPMRIAASIANDKNRTVVLRFNYASVRDLPVCFEKAS